MPPSGPSSAPSGSFVEVVVLELLGVDRARAVLGLQRIEGPAGLLAPRLLALELARLAGARLGSGQRRAALERAAIGDVPGDERRLGGD